MNICERLNAGLGALFQCVETEGNIRVSTPYLYPDGDNIDLFCKTGKGIVTVSDLGETTRWLRMQTISAKRSKKQRAFIEDACLTHGVEFYKGMILARSRESDNLASVIMRVSQAALRVSDLWFSFRVRAFESVTDEVADFLTEQKFGFDRGTKRPGRSGRIWTPDFHVRTPLRS